MVVDLFNLLLALQEHDTWQNPSCISQYMGKNMLVSLKHDEEFCPQDKEPELSIRLARIWCKAESPWKHTNTAHKAFGILVEARVE